ncbi:hypothetical protein PR202_ga24235 [Eleusine coracana subsp. coracana]|uniref:Reverse transcriptase zinc-binding domain-containing protein n=1 Tax=Eleusine coracana subsp. coracana TaxID=191504 RepID=A0AAV5D8Y2_ELECO|nr:hypothetical protein PR202_ga24235 [Eleusine coracana subsp. coracana]
MDRARKSMFWKGAAECSGDDCQVAWDRACRPQEDGGLGVKDLHTQNLCLLLKFLHKVVTRDNAPWVRWIHRQYKPSERGFRTNPTNTNAWNVLTKLMPLYQAITSVDMGNGESTFFWYDDWTSFGPLHQALPAAFSHCTKCGVTVRDALSSGTLTLELHPRLSQAARNELGILTNQLSSSVLEDRPDVRYMRGATTSGFKTTKAYELMCPPGVDLAWQVENWANFAPRKVQNFFWVLRNGNTRTRAFLHARGAVDTPDCPFCVGAVETIDHLFVACPSIQSF